MALKASTIVLNQKRAATGSQWRSWRRGVTWENLGRLKTRRAAAFWLCCNSWVAEAGSPAKRELYSLVSTSSNTTLWKYFDTSKLILTHVKAQKYLHQNTSIIPKVHNVQNGMFQNHIYDIIAYNCNALITEYSYWHISMFIPLTFEAGKGGITTIYSLSAGYFVNFRSGIK